MPKEIAHFAMARMTGDALDAGHEPFSLAVRQYPSLFVLGGVTPDINFYCLAGPGAKEIQALSAPFHRTDQRALLPVLTFLDRQARAGKGEIPLPALALAAGVICHIMADTVFHPMVYYFAGMDGVHPRATVRHRQFETALDLCFWQDGPRDHWLGRRISSLEVSRQALVVLLADLFRAGHPRDVRRALLWHTGVQSLFFAPWMKVIMAACHRMGRPFPGKATGLVYPFRRGMALPFFSEKILYYDPCTRDRIDTRIADMAREAVDGALGVLALAAEGIRQRRDLAEFIMGHPGLPRVRPGLPEDRFSLWKEEEDIMPRIYRGVAPPF